MQYLDFIASKRHTAAEYGINASSASYGAFDYQEFVAERAIRKGRMAVFLDTGLGKTLIELIVADAYRKHFNRRVLIITPLAVAFQVIREAEKFGIDDIEYSKDGKFTKSIVICNYERLDKFDPADFVCVILDESSILKNFNGATKAAITSFLKNVQYRYLFTATPSPNDFIELGTSSEALGYMGYMDMLGKFFTNNEDTVSPVSIGTKWVLKGHAESDFFQWVSSWSISMRKPSDLGFSDDRHILPDLAINHSVVSNDRGLCINGQHNLFAVPSSRLTEVREESKATIENRCIKAAELSQCHETSVYWCNLNNEGDMLADMDKGAVQIRGSMKLEQKEEILFAFASGEIKRLITKPKITCFGLNWQHCNHTAYFPTFSYEQYYHAIRRFWRFGQKRKVTVDLVYSEGMEKVVNSLQVKAKKADSLFSNLNNSINQPYVATVRQFDKQVKIPSFLKG